MTNPEPVDGNCNSTNTRGGGYCEQPAGFGTDHVGDGYCKFHGGAATGGKREGAGAPEGNLNAAKHHMQSDPSSLYQNLGDEKRAIVDDAYASIVESLADRHGCTIDDVPEHLRLTARRVAMNYLKSTVLSEEWQMKQAKKSGNPLIEKDHIPEDGGPPVEVNSESKVEKIATRLSNENRQWLKDMGIVGSADEQQADAAEEIAQAWKESADRYREENR